MLSAYDDVMGWAAGRPWWQQQVVARLARGELLGDDDYVSVASSLLSEAPPVPDGGWFAGLVAPTASLEKPVRILAIRGLENVNRPASGQELTFGRDGITVVYGNNGSGKSGYARVLRSLVRTRYRADILPDVFAESPGELTAQVLFAVGDAERTAELGSSEHALGRAAFYDEHCGDTYLDSESEISYRPSAIQLLDDLTQVCNGVRAVIDVWRTEKSKPVPLPAVDGLGAGGVFLESISATTSDEALEAGVACPAGAEQRLEQQVAEVARLRTADPDRERRRLAQLADALDVVADHLLGLDKSLGADAALALARLERDTLEKGVAAKVASSVSFADETLAEVGSASWLALWRAAEAYSQVAYPEHAFPHTQDDAVCVLCQQRLSDGAAERLERFRDFVADTAASQAAKAMNDMLMFTLEIRRVAIAPQAVTTAIAVAEQSYEGFTLSVQPLLDGFAARQSALTDNNAPAVDVATTSEQLRGQAKRHRQEAAAVGEAGFAKFLSQAEAEERRIRDQISLRDAREGVWAERQRLRELATLNACFSEANTRSITDKVAELTRTHVTEEARDRFTREADRLGLERVTFRATRARQGALLHRTEFLNAREDTRLSDVLSEGEQTALGFAGFLTEAHFETSKSVLIFDDPVSSLDHMKRDAVAKRIVGLAEERQVIVFTHDASFSTALRKFASEKDVEFATRGVERRRKVGPGFTTTTHPWTAQDAAQRIDSLRQAVAKLRKSEQGMTESEYLTETESVAGHMSQTWERIISQVLAEPLVDYKSLEVRVNMLKVVGRVTGDDVKAYDDSYSRISGWAARHDQHLELNYTPPSVQDLTTEVDVLDAWFKKVRGYRNP